MEKDLNLATIMMIESLEHIEHSLKASIPTKAPEKGIVISAIDEHPLNAKFQTIVTEGIFISLHFGQIVLFVKLVNFQE